MGDYAAVKEEVHGKFLAVGRVLVTDTDAVKRMEKGAVIENLHYIGDNAWKFAKSLRTPI
jgi:predicted RNA-binding protein (TIGR00451 family)